MKRLLATSIAFATLTTAAQANVFLPNIGVDGWNSDGIFAYGASLNQGYMTLSGEQNHIINPAYSLDLQNSAQANMNIGSQVFHGGTWTNLFGQNVGIYLGRPTNDAFLYSVDTNGNGFLDSNISDLTGRAAAPTSLFDLYWASSMGAGDIGLRLNFRARSVSDESQINNDDVESTVSGGIYETHLTAGFNSNDMPLEATVHFGLPFGSYETRTIDDNADTENVTDLSFDSGLRWGATGKFTLIDNSTDRLQLSGYVGGTAASYNFTSEELENENEFNDDLHMQSRLALGLGASFERFINNRTRLISSVGLNRSSSTIGYEDQLENQESEDYREAATWTMPVAIGFEFASSDRNTWTASVSDNLFTRTSASTHVWNAGEEEAEETTSTATMWGSSNPRVRFGLQRELVERLHGTFVINRSLVSNTFNSGLATHAQISYEF